MPNYTYEAVTSTGETISSELAAESLSDAIQLLEARGLIIQSIRAVSISTSAELQVDPRSAFYRHVDAALARRETLIPALEALADEMTPKSVAQDIRKLVSNLRRGATTEDFIQDESSAAWLPLVVRGIASQSAADRYQQLVGEATRTGQTRTHRRRLIAYPLIVSGLALFVLATMFVTVVPSFRRMFREFGLRLPPPTRLIMWMSDQFTEHPVRLIVSCVVLASVAFVLIRLWLRHALTTRLLGGPTAGNSANVTAMARFTGTLAEMLSIDAPLPDALRIAGRSCQHRHFREMADRLAQDVGLPHRSLQESPVVHNFPKSMIHALELGPDRRPNIPLLRQLSAVYSDRVRRRTDWTSSLLGPLAIIGVGAAVAFIVIALFMPLVMLVTGAAHY